MSTIAPTTSITTLIPVTTMEEIPMLSEQQHAELVASLREAEQEVALGRGVSYDSNDMRAHFMQGIEEKRVSHA
jgi:hypothetical protein